MTNPIIKEINTETGIETEREMTADEIAQHEIDSAKFAELENEKIAKESGKQAVLDKLGLTADEAKFLLS